MWSMDWAGWALEFLAFALLIFIGLAMLLAVVLFVSAVRGDLTIIAPVIHALFAVTSATYAWQSRRHREENSHHGN